MIGSFLFNGVYSSSFNLICKSIKRPLLPAMKVNRVEPIGLSGAYDFGDDEYDLRKITMQIAYIGTSYEELRSRARDIASWLFSYDWVQLKILDEDDKYYLARVTSEIDLKSLYESGTADIVFDCQPFAYSTTDEQVERVITAFDSFLFNNPGTRRINYKSPPGSKLTVTIDGSFTLLNLRINDEIIGFPNPVSSKVIVIDSIEMTVYEGSNNIFNTVTQDIDKFYTIEPGQNQIVAAGTGMNLTLTVDYRPLWL